MNPITITITAATAEAAEAIRKFATDTGASLKDVVKHGHEAEGVFMANKMAIMEMEHSARSLADGLISGINPLRMLAMEGPRLMEAGTFMTEEFKAKIMGFLPILGGIGVAIAAGAIAWHYYGDALVDPTKRARDLATALEAIPDILKQIETATRAGSLSPEAAQKYKDMLSGATPLYNVTTVADAYGGHAGTVKNGAFGLFGEAFPQLTTDPNERNSRTGAIIGQRQPANQADITKYVEQLMRTEKVTDANDKTQPGDDALAKLHDAEIKMQRDALLGIDKEIARIHDRYEIERRELLATADVAKATHKWNPAEEAKLQSALAGSKSEEQQSIDEINQRAAEEAARKTAEAQAKAREEALKDGREQLKTLEAQITEDQDKAGQKRGELAGQEYIQRVALLTKLLFQGKIEEDEYNDKVVEAQHKAIDAAREYAEELKKIAALEREVARAKTESQLQGIDRNPYLTDQQKNQQSLPLLQNQQSQNAAAMADLLHTASTTKDDAARLEAMKQYYALQTQSAELQAKINQDQVTFGQQFEQTIVKLQNQWGTWATQGAHLFETVFTTATNTISSNITKLIEGTTTWSRALMQIGTTILNSIIESIVKAVVEATLLAAVTRLAALAGLNIGGGKPNPATEAAWGAAAMLRSIADLGPIAGPIAFTAELAASAAAGTGAASFAAGGYTGDGGQFDPAGIVHRGEYVFSQATVNRIGRDALDNIHYGGASPSAGANGQGASGGSKVSVYSYTDPRLMQQHLEKNDDHEKYVVDVMRRNMHKFQ